jgi:radical SAM protein with 4Fe4S-binding SPASM domain
MPKKADLGQKSLGHVTEITGFSPVNCDGYHRLVCDTALLGQVSGPTMGGMPTASQLSAGTSKPTGAGRVPVSRTSGIGAAPGFKLRPLQVTWEMTRTCGWKATNSRPARSAPRETNHFSTAEAFHLIEDVASMHVPLLALTGGDPLTRPDLFPIIEFASRRSVRTSLTLLPTPNLEGSIIAELKACGLMRAGFWLHGSTPALNDSYWGVAGLHRRTLDIIGACHEVQLPVQVNTIVSKRNVQDLDSMIELLTRLDVALWNVVFFVPASRDEAGVMLSAEEHEDVFAKLYAASRHVHFQIKTTEGQHYQRYLLQQRVRESRGRLTEAEVMTCAPKGVNDSKGLVYINNRGEAYSSRFLPISAGDVTRQSLSEVYCESPLFVSLRDSSRLKGKCGQCPAHAVCGGSRARAYVMTGDLFASDPCCAFEP